LNYVELDKFIPREEVVFLKIRLFIFMVITLLILGSSGVADANNSVDLKLVSTSDCFVIGEVFEIKLMVVSEEDKVAGVSAFIDFDPSVFSIIDCELGDELPVIIGDTPKIDNNKGELDINLGSWKPYPEGTFEICSLKLRALRVAEETSLSFSSQKGGNNCRNSLVAFKGQNILINTEGLTISIQ